MIKINPYVKVLLVFPVIVLIGLSPILVAMLGGAITELFGKQANEAVAPDIPIIGGILGIMNASVWFFLATVPIAGLLLIIYVPAAIVKLVMIWRERHGR